VDYTSQKMPRRAPSINQIGVEDVYYMSASLVTCKPLLRVSVGDSALQRLLNSLRNASAANLTIKAHYLKHPK
jgi:hypothetical protein